MAQRDKRARRARLRRKPLAGTTFDKEARRRLLRRFPAAAAATGEGGSDWGDRHGGNHGISGLAVNTPSIGTFPMNQFSSILGFIVLVFL